MVSGRPAGVPVIEVATLGAASSANKGAAAMLQAVVDSLPGRVGPCRVTVLTTFPESDAREPPAATEACEIRIRSATPLLLLVLLYPLAILSWVLHRVGIPRRLICRPASLRALLDADVVVDLAGISFADGRGMPTLAYNTLMSSLPLLLGRPTVKLSQAMGPFRNPVNRFLASRVLSSLEAVCPRGERTESHLADLGLTNSHPAADVSFLMEVGPASVAAASSVLSRGVDDHEANGTPWIIVMPSSVVHRSSARRGLDYPALIASLIDDLVERVGNRVALVPHSSRPGDSVDRMNDRPTCREVYARVEHRDHVLLVDESLPPATLRAIIAAGDVLVTSRFHAMVSALATSTPVQVVGWSHKYAEVLAEFGLEDRAIDFTAVSNVALVDAVVSLLDDREAVRRQIERQLPGVHQRATINLEVVARALDPKGSPQGGVRAEAIVRDSLRGVIDNDMCIGCGVCAIADPTVHVELDPSKQIYQPDHAAGPEAAAVCPAVQVDFAGLQARVFPGQEVTEFGVVDSVWLAQSSDVERNNRSSSGGLIKEILLELLESPEVDGIIALGHVDGLDFEPRLVTHPEEVDRLPGSIYHNLSQVRALELLREHSGRFVLVAIPCQLEGIYQYIERVEPALLDRIHTTVGLLCGWQYGHHAIRAISQYLGVEYDEITDISYRGGGPVGKLRIRTEDGTEVSASRRVDFGYQVAFDRHFNTPRCHVCINHSNFLADVVVGDAWLPSTVFTKTGVSLLICRKPHTTTMLDRMAGEGRIVRTRVTNEEIRESQTDRVIFGDFAYAYGDYLDELGLHHPDMAGPNRARARLSPRREVEHFHRELRRKLALQRAGRYRYLWWRKATVELPRFLARYWRWFTVRILRVKSITGRRKELPREQLADFR